MSLQNDIVLNRLVYLRENIDIFEDKALKEILKLYKQSAIELNDSFPGLKGSFTRAKRLSLLREIEEKITFFGEVVAEPISDVAAEVGAYSYAEMGNIVSWDGQVEGFNAVSLTTAQLKQLTLTQKLGDKKLDEWISKPILDEIKKGYIQGEGYKSILKRMNATILGDKALRDVESIVKTYVQSMAVKAHQDVYEANADIVDYVEWTAIMENGNVKTGRGTCPRCMALDGQRWKTTNYNRPNCPLHALCRCDLLPITKTWKELGFDIEETKKNYESWAIRDDKNRIIEFGHTGQNYAGWWKTRSIKFQNNAVGVTRANFIRDGKIDFADIVDDKGNLINIKDLIKKHNIKIDKPPTPIKKKHAASTFVDKKFPEQADIKKAIREANRASKRTRFALKSVNDEIDKIKKIVVDNPNKAFDYTSKLYALFRKQEKLNEKLIIRKTKVLKKTIQPPEGGILPWKKGRVGSRIIGGDIEKWNRKIKEVEDMYHPDVLKNMPEYTIEFKRGDRAYHQGVSNIIRMGNDDTSTLIHEFSHGIERHTEGYIKRALSFRKRRTEGEKLTRIYRQEYGWKDQFFKHYCGKDYGERATEIISMGVQKMYTDPYDFYITDPDYFDFILKIMWGKK